MDLVYSQEKSFARDKFEKEEIIEKDGVDVDKVYEDDVRKRCSDGSKILDIGIGTGYIPLQIVRKSEKAVKVIGMDLSKSMVKIARKNTASLHNVAIIRQKKVLETHSVYSMIDAS